MSYPASGKGRPEPAYACNKCEKMTLCSFCPGFFELENGAEDLISEYLCELGRNRVLKQFKELTIFMRRINMELEDAKQRTEAPI